MRRKKMSFGGIVLLILIGVLIFVSPQQEGYTEPVAETVSLPSAQGELLVHYLDVGQGDSVFIQLPNGETALIDAGENNQGKTVCRYIADQGEDTIDYLIGTHPHSDHIGGLDTVINNFHIGTLYLPDKSATTKTFAEVVSAAKEKDIRAVQAKAGVSILQEENLSLAFLSPISTEYAETNDYSAVVSLVYGKNSFLFMGDAEYTVEKELKHKVSHYDVLKVGHHGSNTSSTANFLEQVTPAYAVISCGKDNSYGHPHTQVLNRLQRFGATVYRTDQQGTILAASDGENLTFETER